MHVGEIGQFCGLQAEGDVLSLSKYQSLMQAAMMQLDLSTRVCHRTRYVKLARTIADLVGSEEIQSAHLAEALQHHRKIMMGYIKNN